MSARADVAPLFALLKPAKLARLIGAVALALAVALPLSRSDVATAAITVVAGCVVAAGANALNMFLDRERDARDPQTSLRPLPAGAVRPWSALAFAVLLIMIGAWIIVSRAGVVPAASAIAAVAVYATIYSWLKQRTPYYTLVGGAIWAAPILVLWLALGRSIAAAPAEAFVVAALWTTLHVWSSALIPGTDTVAAAPLFLPHTRGPFVTRVHVIAIACALGLLTIGLGMRAMLPFDAVLIIAAGASLVAGRAQVARAVSLAAIFFIAAFIVTTAIQAIFSLAA